MEAIVIDLPAGEEYLPGDLATVLVDDAVVARDVDLAPGREPHPGHLRGAHLQTPHLASRDDVGHLQGRHLRDPHLQPRRHIGITTDEYYHGLHAATVRTRDSLGNEADGDPPSIEVFLNTGPTAPTGIRFDSQEDGGGAISFAFTPALELAA